MDWQVGQRVRLVDGHEAPDRPPLVVRARETVSVGRNHTEGWPAFVWTVDAGGIGGWVPERCLRRTSADRAEVVHDYDTTELTAPAGTEIEVLEIDTGSGWLRCRDTAGEMGWVPMTAAGG